MISRVLRFRRFLSRIDVAGAAVDLAGLAAETGYADQAHMTRESTRLAGLPPAALARERAAGRTLAVGGRWAEERARAEGVDAGG